MWVVLIANGIIVIIYSVVHQIAKTKTKAVRKIIWGSLTTFPLSVITSFVIGLNYNFIERGSPPMGFEVAVFLTPLFVISGLIILGIGITELFKHKKQHRKKSK